MADNENYLVAIDILRCHLGKSYEEACEVLGLKTTATDVFDSGTPELIMDMPPLQSDTSVE